MPRREFGRPDALMRASLRGWRGGCKFLVDTEGSLHDGAERHLGMRRTGILRLSVNVRTRRKAYGTKWGARFSDRRADWDQYVKQVMQKPHSAVPMMVFAIGVAMRVYNGFKVMILATASGLTAVDDARAVVNYIHEYGVPADLPAPQN